MKIERTKKNYNVKLVFLDEDNKEVFNATTNTNLIEEMYGIGVVGLQELYNSAVKSFNDTKPPEEVIKNIAESALSGIENSKIETPLEDSFITINKEEWLKKTLDVRSLSKDAPSYIRVTNDDLLCEELNYDYEIIKNAKAYALNAIFSYKGKAITCETYRYNTIVDLKDFLKDKQYVLYCVQQYTTTGIPNPDPNPFVPFIERPMTKYIFRGVILDEHETN